MVYVKQYLRNDRSRVWGIKWYIPDMKAQEDQSCSRGVVVSLPGYTCFLNPGHFSRFFAGRTPRQENHMRLWYPAKVPALFTSFKPLSFAKIHLVGDQHNKAGFHISQHTWPIPDQDWTPRNSSQSMISKSLHRQNRSLISNSFHCKRLAPQLVLWRLLSLNRFAVEVNDMFYACL